LFVSGANGIHVSESTFSDSFLGGVLLHRYVSNGVIERTTSAGNAGDGFSIDRATTGITISESKAEGNAGSGFTLDGRPLADGPSPTGAPLKTYGNNSIVNSVAIRNARYGIELLGGHNLGISSNQIDDHDMGVVVHGPAERVSITGNTVEASERHGIALVDGVTDSTVTGNVVEHSSTGVYLRDSSSEVKGNTVEGAGSHGISLVGEVGGSDVAMNVLAGSGASALDTMRSEGPVTIGANNTDGWTDTTPWYALAKKLLRPMNALWCAIAALVVLSAIRSRRATAVVGHPYAHQVAHLTAPAAPQHELARPHAMGAPLPHPATAPGSRPVPRLPPLQGPPPPRMHPRSVAAPPRPAAAPIAPGHHVEASNPGVSRNGPVAAPNVSLDLRDRRHDEPR
jgi:parallel beta-helix repeat protein